MLRHSAARFLTLTKVLRSFPGLPGSGWNLAARGSELPDAFCSRDSLPCGLMRMASGALASAPSAHPSPARWKERRAEAPDFAGDARKVCGPVAQLVRAHA